MTSRNKIRDLPYERYILALKRMRHFIAQGRALKSENSNAVGNKYTECSWGMCDESAEMWPDSEDHKWPDEFLNSGRIAPLDMDDTLGHSCPFDRRSDEDVKSGQGCYWSCMVFRPYTYEPEITKDLALGLYSKKIAHHLKIKE